MTEKSKIIELIQDCKKALLEIVPSDYWQRVQETIDKCFIVVFKELCK